MASDAKRASADQARRLEDEAARRGDLVTYLAHDLKTPLTSVIGYLSLLDEVPDMPAAQRERYTGVALDKALRLERLVNEFFDITRYNLTHIELERAPVDVAALLVQLADEFYPALSAHGNTVLVEVEGTTRTTGAPGDALMADVDAARLARVLGNLLRNAIAYSDEGTEVTLRAPRSQTTPTPCASRSETSAPRSRATSSGPSSTSSIGSTSPAPPPRAARDWGLPSRVRSWSCTAGPSPLRARAA